MDLSRYAQQIHGRGARPPSADALALIPEHQHTIAVEELPEAVDLTALAGPPNDQGDEGSCVGEATAKAVGLLYAVKAGQPVALSPAFAYYEARVLEDDTSQDDGADPTDALSQAQNIGVCTEAQMPYVAGQFATEPNPEQVADAGSYKIGSSHSIADSNGIMQALAANLPVMVTIGASDSFEQTPADGIVPQSSLDDLPHDWDHEQVIVGFNNSAMEQLGIPPGYFKLLNSWSAAWGDGGYYFVPISRFDFFLAPLVPVLTVAPAPAATTTALTVTPNPAAIGSTVSLEASVTGATPTGAVAFSSGAGALSTVQLGGDGTATTSVTAAAAGTFVITAAYSGDENNQANTSPEVSLVVAAPTPNPTPDPFVPSPIVVSWLAWQQQVAGYLVSAYSGGDLADTQTWQAELAQYEPGIAQLVAAQGKTDELDAAVASAQSAVAAAQAAVDANAQAIAAAVAALPAVPALPA